MLTISACKTLDNLAATTDAALGVSSEVPVEETFQVWTLDAKGEASKMTAVDPKMQRVLRALAARARGYGPEEITAALQVNGIETVSFQEPAINSFELSKAVVFGDVDPLQIGEKSRVAGILVFEDDSGRQANVAYQAAFDYTLGANGTEPVRLHDPNLSSFFADDPQASLFVARVSDINTSQEYIVSNYARFYKAVTDVAVPVRDIAALPAGQADYLFIAFIQTQIAPGDRIQMEYMSQSDQTTGQGANSFYRMYQGGWAVAMVRQTVDLKTDDGGWIKLSLKPDPDGPRPYETTRTLGLYAAGPQSQDLAKSQAQATGE
ncbi:MAG: hypothetical protein AAF530_14980 [Pseudomonadota bacterium]